MWSLGITFPKLYEFTVTVILVWFATLLNATSDLCRSLPALITVTANCNVFVFLFSSFNSRASNDDPENLHSFSLFWNSSRGGEAQSYRDPILHYYGNSHMLTANTRPGLAVAASGKSVNYVFVSTPVRALLIAFCSLNCTQ
jgi:hypothetical protein